MKEYAPSRSNFFPFRVFLIVEGLDCPEKEIGSHKSCSIGKNSSKTWGIFTS